MGTAGFENANQLVAKTKMEKVKIQFSQSMAVTSSSYLISTSSTRSIFYLTLYPVHHAMLLLFV